MEDLDEFAAYLDQLAKDHQLSGTTETASDYRIMASLARLIQSSGSPFLRAKALELIKQG